MKIELKDSKGRICIQEIELGDTYIDIKKSKFQLDSENTITKIESNGNKGYVVMYIDKNKIMLQRITHTKKSFKLLDEYLELKTMDFAQNMWNDNHDLVISLKLSDYAINNVINKSFC